MSNVYNVQRKREPLYAFQVTQEMCQGTEEIPFEGVLNDPDLPYLNVPVKTSLLDLSLARHAAKPGEWVIDWMPPKEGLRRVYQILTNKAFCELYEIVEARPMKAQQPKPDPRQLDLFADARS